MSSTHRISRDGDPLDWAFAAYHRTDGPTAPIPGDGSEVVPLDGREYVVLRNVRGVLAVYLIQPPGRLWRLDGDEWPEELQDEDAS